MMEHYVSVYGTRYFSSEPLYCQIESGLMVFDRVKRRWLDWDALAAKAAAEGHTWQPREIGIPSIQWQLANWNGQRYAPGLDDTTGLASEQITNGEDFTGATGATPPTGWVAGGSPNFALFGSVLGMDGNAGAATCTQNLTGLTPGAVYVVETSIHEDTTNGYIIYEGHSFPVSPPTLPGDEYKLISFTFTADDDGTAQVGIGCGEGGYIAINYFRVYLESELTGA